MVLARAEYTISTLFDGENFYRAYADSADGSLRFHETESNRLYLGTYVGRTKPTHYSQYQWTLVKGAKGDPGPQGAQGPKGPQGDKGKDGVAGKDGVGIKSTAVTYGLSTSDSKEPTEWDIIVPPLTKGQYLWTKTVWYYTDNTHEKGYSKTYSAKDGNDGNNGLPGKDGVGITKTTFAYAKSTSGTTQPTSGWTPTVPSANPGEYIWTKTEWTYTDDTTETGYSVRSEER